MDESWTNDPKFAPKGDIAPLREALRAFAPAANIPEPIIDRQLEGIARRFNYLTDKDRNRSGATQRQKLPRASDVAAEFEDITQKAAGLARALMALSDIANDALVSDGLALKLSRFVSQRSRQQEVEKGLFVGAEWDSPLPELRTSNEFVAFSQEILNDAEWYEKKDFLKPTIARVQALAAIAKDKVTEFQSNGGSSGRNKDLSAQFEGLPKPMLVNACFRLVFDLFGEDAAAKCSATPVVSSARRPLFATFLAAMYDYAVGGAKGKNEGICGTSSESNFEDSLKKNVPRLRDLVVFGHEFVQDDGTINFRLPWTDRFELEFSLRNEIEALGDGDKVGERGAVDYPPIVLCQNKQTALAVRKDYSGYSCVIAPVALREPEKAFWHAFEGRAVRVWVENEAERANAAKAKAFFLKTLQFDEDFLKGHGISFEILAGAPKVD